MNRWLVFVRERYPLVTSLLLSGGMASSGYALSGKPFEPVPYLLVLAGFVLFFFQLRLMDEVKDLDKDLVAHPERPLPRGLVQPSEVRKLIMLMNLVLGLFCVVASIWLGRVPALVFASIVVFLQGMYREFFVGHWLGERPLLYALTHQGIIVLLALFAVTAWQERGLQESATWALGLVFLAGFFAIELCRKLDPNAHPALKTYLATYGRFKTLLLVLATCVVGAWGAVHINLWALTGPFQALLVLSYLFTFAKPGAYKMVEGIAGLSLLVHLWGVALKHWLLPLLGA